MLGRVPLASTNKNTSNVPGSKKLDAAVRDGVTVSEWMAGDIGACGAKITRKFKVPDFTVETCGV